MPGRTIVPAELRDRPFTVGQALAAGVTVDQLRGAAYRRLVHGVYMRCGPAADDETALLAGTALRLPPGCAFSGPTAARIYGIDLRAPTRVEVQAPTGGNVWARRGVRVRRGQLDPCDRTERGGLPVTTPVRTAYDLARHLPILEAVAAVDAMLNRRLLEPADLAGYAVAHPGLKGAPQARKVIDLADPLAESPMESMLRTTLVLAGLPRPESQVRIYDRDGLFIGRVDLYYRERRLAIEYDGQGHRDSLVVDLRRQNALLVAGYRLLRFSHADLIGRPQAVVVQVHAELNR